MGVTLKPKPGVIIIKGRTKIRSNFDDFERLMRLKVGADIDKAGAELLKVVQQKFNTPGPRESSKAGQYPRKISGRLKESITVKKYTKGSDFIGIQISNSGPHGLRLGWLSKGVTKGPAIDKPYAIPVSPEARMASTLGKGPREAFGEMVVVFLSSDDKKTKGRKGSTGKKRLMVLVEPKGEEYKPVKSNPGSYEKQKIGFFSVLGRYGNRSKRSPSGLPLYDQFGRKIHYILSFKGSKIQPRKGLKDAVEDSMEKFFKKFGG